MSKTRWISWIQKRILPRTAMANNQGVEDVLVDGKIFLLHLLEDLRCTTDIAHHAIGRHQPLVGDL